jgi:hypothetical protein
MAGMIPRRNNQAPTIVYKKNRNLKVNDNNKLNRKETNSNIHSYIHKYIHTNIYTYKYTYIHTYKYTYIPSSSVDKW